MPAWIYTVIVGFSVLALASVVTYKTFTPPQWVQTTTTAEFGGVSLKLEYALTPEEREQGLGGRESIRSDYGMLFVFPKADYYGFWMKDMHFPIDIFWLNAKGQVIDLHEGVATSTFPHVFYPPQPSLYVLETAAGFGELHGVETGTTLLLKNFPIVTK